MTCSKYILALYFCSDPLNYIPASSTAAYYIGAKKTQEPVPPVNGNQQHVVNMCG